MFLYFFLPPAVAPRTDAARKADRKISSLYDPAFRGSLFEACPSRTAYDTVAPAEPPYKVDIREALLADVAVNYTNRIRLFLTRLLPTAHQAASHGAQRQK
jgi:hypothetical protein